MHVGLLERDRRGFNINVPYVKDRTVFQMQLEKIKQPLGTFWDKDNRTWYMPGPETVLDFERCGITYNVSTASAQMRLDQFRNSLDASLWARDQAPDEMYGYQAAGSQYLYWAQRAILADAMGLGKTKQTIDAVRRIWCEHGPVRTLIVVLKTLTYNWQAELYKWFPGVPVEIVPEGPKLRTSFWERIAKEEPIDGCPIIICNYEKLSLGDFPQDFQWDIVVADEATYVKNPAAIRSKAFHRVADGAHWVWLLTGTPIEIRYEELHGLFSYIRPAVFGTFSRFRDAHLVTDFNGNVIGARDVTLMTERIAPWVLRRTKEDVQLQLPPKVYNDVVFELSASERDIYRQLLGDFDTWLAERGDSPSDANVLTQMLRLQQHTSSPNLLDVDGERGSKFSLLRDIVSEWEGQVLVFTRFSEMADRLRLWLELPRDAIIKGEVSSAQERLRRITEFNAGMLGQTLVSTDAGAHGLNITSADLIIHYDMLWNPAKLRQREDRLHRIGQQRTVNVLRLLADQTIDQGMAQITDFRQTQADSLLNAADEVMIKRLNYKKIARGESGVASQAVA